MEAQDWCRFFGWGQEQIDGLRQAAYTYVQQGGYEIALSFFEALTVLAPEAAFDLQTLGALHLQLGHSSEALEVLDQALKLDPHDLLTQLNRAKALFMLGYKKQGLLLAQELEKVGDPEISSQASALVLSFK